MSKTNHRFIGEIPFEQLKFNPNRSLGKGSFGTVYKGRWASEHVAIKEFKTKEEIHSFEIEVEQLSRVSHSAIIELLGASRTPKRAYLVMEYSEIGSLNHLLYELKNQSYDLKHACCWATQAAKGVAYLHAMTPKPIVHRDLKPANLLLFEKGKKLKICDFGTACTVRSDMTNNTGSAPYMAPEVFSTSNYHESADVYSWSIVFWEILARQHPYPNAGNVHAILWQVNKYGKRPSVLESCPTRIWRLITRCWDGNPKNRPRMQSVADEMKQFIASCELRLSYRSSSEASTPQSNNRLTINSPQTPTPTPTAIMARYQQLDHLPSSQPQSDIRRELVYLYHRLKLVKDRLSSVPMLIDKNIPSDCIDELKDLKKEKEAKLAKLAVLKSSDDTSDQSLKFLPSPSTSRPSPRSSTRYKSKQ